MVLTRQGKMLADTPASPSTTAAEGTPRTGRAYETGYDTQSEAGAGIRSPEGSVRSARSTESAKRRWILEKMRLNELEAENIRLRQEMEAIDEEEASQVLHEDPRLAEEEFTARSFQYDETMQRYLKESYRQPVRVEEDGSRGLLPPPRTEQHPPARVEEDGRRDLLPPPRVEQHPPARVEEDGRRSLPPPPRAELRTPARVEEDGRRDLLPPPRAEQRPSTRVEEDGRRVLPPPPRNEHRQPPRVEEDGRRVLPPPPRDERRQPTRAAYRDSTILYKFSRPENLARLRYSLRGEAREAVYCLMSTANDPEIIMRTLEQRFGRPEYIIDKALEDLSNLPRLGNSSHDLNLFAVKLQNIVCVLSTLDDQGYLRNPKLAREVTAKLTPHLQTRWCDYAEEKADRNRPQIEVLSEFLMREADRAVRHTYDSTKYAGSASRRTEQTPRTRTLRAPPPRVPPPRNEHRPRNSIFIAKEGPKVKKYEATCLCCGGPHDVPSCKKYQRMSLDERWQWVRDERICFGCVNKKHRRYTCKAKKCGKDGCNYGHHPSLHGDRPNMPASRDNAPPNNAAPQDTDGTVMTATRGNEKILLKMCKVIVKGPTGIEVKTHALLDEGATLSLINKDLAQRLQADGPRQGLRIHGIGSMQYQAASKNVTVTIRGLKMLDEHQLRARTIDKLSTGRQTVGKECLRFNHLKVLREEEVCFNNAVPEILIGLDNWHLIVSQTLLEGKPSEPIAGLTRLGWVIHGRVPSLIASDDDTVLHLRTHTDSSIVAAKDDELHGMVKAHFQIEAMGVTTTERLARTTHAQSRCSSRRREIKDATDRWFTGPSFLRLSEEHWPEEVHNPEEVPEEAYVQHVRANIKTPFLTSRASLNMSA
ncbi:putative peptidase (DUF1758) domain-containing protein [Phthorimaea operculella]|nr:putative peptidase (DUF1758) domain-containing protein [Phthorimaea operculella]